MIREQWYAVLDAKELQRNNLLGVTRLSQKLVFWRGPDEEVYCIADQCCHRGAALSAGRLSHGEVACPFHGFRYDGTGQVTLIPAQGEQTPVPSRYRVNAYLAREAYGLIWIWYGVEKTQVPPIPFFEELTHEFSYGGFKEHWAVHYSRAIENQLDVVHLPFVHETTIGRGNRTLVHGPVVTWQGDRMTFYVKNEEDRGQRPQKPPEIKNYERLFSLQFQMPNLWQNLISDRLRILAVFAPIDEENTMIYLRFYQKLSPLPVIRDVINFFSSLSNRIILHQDRRVVLTQRPQKTELRMGEHLIQGDLPIIEYRLRREALKAAALSREHRQNSGEPPGLAPVHLENP